MPFRHKQVNDPVHGSIHLSKIETDIISSKVFQRLHNIKQLGLGVLVYPGANYSRFSHSLGACHLAGEMYDSIWRNSDRVCSDEEKQLYRLCGLMHDIGHYPFSHTFEHAGKHTYAGVVESSDKVSGTFANHEKMGEYIVTYSTEIRRIFEKHHVSIEDFLNTFLSQLPDTLTAIISSDLDCDRLDYLLRTAHHAGLPYGRIDVNYIINAVTTDSAGFVCLEPKASKAADHMLVSRYYDYAQLPFHKTSSALEMSLEKIIEHLIIEGLIDCSEGAMIEKIKNEKWNSFDDQYLTSIIRSSYNDVEDPFLKAHFKAFLERKPSKCVFIKEIVGTQTETATFSKHRTHLEKKLNSLASRFEINIGHWHIRSQSLSITKIPLSALSPGENSDFSSSENAELVRILEQCSDRGNFSRPLISYDSAIINKLSELSYQNTRLYISDPNLSQVKRNQIEVYIANEVLI